VGWPFLALGALAALPASRHPGVESMTVSRRPAGAYGELAHPETLVLTGAGVTEGRTRVATLTTGHIVGFATTVSTDRARDLEDLSTRTG
jgi:hypothetical protein